MRKWLFFILSLASRILLLPAFTSCLKELTEELTLEEKIGQMLMVHFKGETANEEAEILIGQAHVGSIIYYNWANGLHSPLQVKTLSQGLQKLAEQTPRSIPLFIAIDQEGGIVTRLSKGFTIFPGNKALGMTNDPSLAERCGFAMAEELQAVGINFTLAPVVDIHPNLQSLVIGIRSFSHSPLIVSEFAKNILRGFRSGGVLGALKHFPGHGDIGIDSHKDLAVLLKTKEELYQRELFPYLQLVQEAEAIMTAHLLVPALDCDHCITLSKSALDFLRNEMGFQGLIISDSLVMEGVLKDSQSIDEAAVNAIHAGCDLIILGGRHLIGSEKNLELTKDDILRIHHTIVQAVREGVISEASIDRSVQRILKLKTSYLASAPLVIQPLENHVNTAEHRSLSKEIADRSISLIKHDCHPALKTNQVSVCLLAFQKNQSSILQTSLPDLGKTNHHLFFKELNPTNEEMKTAKKLASEAEIILFCGFDTWKNKNQAKLIESLSKLKIPFVFINLNDPCNRDDFPLIDRIISTFSPTSPSIQAASDLISNPAFWLYD